MIFQMLQIRRQILVMKKRRNCPIYHQHNLLYILLNRKHLQNSIICQVDPLLTLFFMILVDHTLHKYSDESKLKVKEEIYCEYGKEVLSSKILKTFNLSAQYTLTVILKCSKSFQIYL